MKEKENHIEFSNLQKEFTLFDELWFRLIKYNSTLVKNGKKWNEVYMRIAVKRDIKGGAGAYSTLNEVFPLPSITSVQRFKVKYST